MIGAVWTVVALFGAVTVLLFLIFVMESAINAKIEEVRKRKLEKEAMDDFEEYFNDRFKETIDEIINTEIEREFGNNEEKDDDKR